MHPTLGRMVLFKTKKGAYWEAEPMVNGERFGVTFETAEGTLPSDAQLRFYGLLSSYRGAHWLGVVAARLRQACAFGNPAANPSIERTSSSCA